MTQASATESAPRRRWFRFSLRSMLIFTTLIGAGLGWVGKERLQSDKEERIGRQLQQHRSHLEFGGPYDVWELTRQSRFTDTINATQVTDVVDNMSLGPKTTWSPTTPREVQGWWRYFAGLVCGQRVVAVTRFDPNLAENSQLLIGLSNLQELNIRSTAVTDLSPFAGLTNLRSLYLYYTQVTDLTPLAGLTNLRLLYLDYTQVTDLTPLAGLTNLRLLSLKNTQVTDLTPLAGLTNLGSLSLDDTQVIDLTPLAGLTNLQSLWLHSTQVTDLTPLVGLTNLGSLDITSTQVTDLTPLAGLTNLGSLHVDSTQVTDEQVKWLQEKLPKCNIVR